MTCVILDLDGLDPLRVSRLQENQNSNIAHSSMRFYLELWILRHVALADQ
jgi:hypothetical protein